MRTVAPFTWLVISFIGYFGTYGVFLPFLPLWLQEYNYSDNTIAQLIALSFIFRFLGSLLFSQWVKLPSKLIPMLRIIGYSSLLVTIAMAWSVEIPWLLFALICLFNMIYGAGVPLADSLASTWQQQINLDYGKARLTGSLAFIGANLSAGWLLGIWGNQLVIWLIASLLLFYILVQTLTPNPYPQDPDTTTATLKPITYQEILANKPMRSLIIVLALIQGAHASYYTYSALYWTQLGVSVEHTGILWAASVVAEVVLFFFAGRLFKNSSTYRLLFFTVIISAIRWGLMGYVESFSLFLILQLLHCVTFALCHFTAIRYISAQPSHYIPKLQALYSGVCCCLSVAIFIFFSGFVYKHQPAWAFYLMAILVLPALFWLPHLNRKPSTEDKINAT